MDLGIWLKCRLFIYFFIFCTMFFFFPFYFTILYWFCHTSTWICHGYTRVSHPELPSHLPPRTIPLGHPSAPDPSILYPALNLDWRFVSYMILYMFQCHNMQTFDWTVVGQSLRVYIYNQFFSVPSDILKITESKDLNSSSNGDFKLLELKGEVVVMCVWGWLPW